MKNLKSFLLIIFLVNVFITYAQDQKTEFHQLYKNLYEKEKNPFLVINNVLFGNDIAILNIIDPNDIKKINVLKDKAAIDLYGAKGKNGVLIISLKNKDINTIEKFKTAYNLHNSNSKVKDISGTIFNSNNSTIPNVIISNLNRKESFKSDSNGKYSLKARENDILFYSLEGFKSKTIKVNDTKIDIVLNSNSTSEILIK